MLNKSKGIPFWPSPIDQCYEMKFKDSLIPYRITSNDDDKNKFDWSALPSASKCLLNLF